MTTLGLRPPSVAAIAALSARRAAQSAASPRNKSIRATEREIAGALAEKPYERTLEDKERDANAAVSELDDAAKADGATYDQVAALIDSTADVIALNDTCFFDLDRWEFRRCTRELHRRLLVHDVHGGTLAYRGARSSFLRVPQASGPG